MQKWLLALRPKTLSAAVVPILVATSLIYAEGKTIDFMAFWCALLASIFIQIGTNLLNDAIDFKKGADTEERIGPQRVTQSGLLTAKQVMSGGFICLFIALCFGVPLVIKGGWPFIIIGIVSLFLAYSYTGGPFPLAYLGLGDLFVVLFFGVIAVCGVYYLHSLELSLSSLIAGIQVGFLATLLIVINNLRDMNQDVKVNKKTLAVRFGANFSRVEALILVSVVFFLQTYWFLNDHLWASLLPLLSIPIATVIIVGLFKNEPSELYNKYLAKSGALHLVFGLLFSIGILI